ncbi:LacI family DNA-binding transcriptional regulator [Nesterenkonia alba]|uniref:LacI family DNA-binding transcriptional regulator n=1 Tax=Nesterenkonia alba TaxID=515814 RepID=UPI0003F7701C|nr:LacI family DNA-binding transcriptional regulator [Nesterenkonia alba]
MSAEISRTPTIDDVASAAGVSKSTVSRALLKQSRVSATTRQKVLAAAADLGYVPNVMASELAQHSGGTIGLLLRDASNPAYGLLFTLLHQEATAAGLRVVSTTIGSGPGGRSQEQVAALDWLMGMRVSGLIVATGGVFSEQLQPFHERIPILRAGRPEATGYIHAVSYDEQHAGEQLGRLVAEAGHRRVAVLRTVPEVSYPEYVRGTAMIDALTERGIEPVEVEVTPETDGIAEALHLVCSAEATAVMCPNDMRQLALIRVFAEAGLHAPQDYSVTGYDGVTPGVDLLGLATYRIGVETLAQRTVAHMKTLLAEEPAEPIREVVRGELLPGRTVAPPGSRQPGQTVPTDP